jgi:coenzyme F420-reducing hydrogenase delta subunit
MVRLILVFLSYIHRLLENYRKVVSWIVREICYSLWAHDGYLVEGGRAPEGKCHYFYGVMKNNKGHLQVIQLVLPESLPYDTWAFGRIRVQWVSEEVGGRIEKHIRGKTLTELSDALEP